jgi:hypothetical protein
VIVDQPTLLSTSLTATVLGPGVHEFCRACGAGLGPHRRDGEGTCKKCDPAIAIHAAEEEKIRQEFEDWTGKNYSLGGVENRWAAMWLAWKAATFLERSRNDPE